MTRLLRPVLAAFVAVLVVLVPGAAGAHDELVASEPADGATVQAPAEVLLRFSGEIAQVGALVQITGEDDDLTDGDPVVQGTEVVQPLDDLDPGDYEVAWRVTSSDGHPISGSFDFTVQDEDAAETDDEATEEETTGPGATEEETTEDATERDEVAPTPEETTQTVDEDGLPAWAWIVVGVALLGLVALLGRTWSRGRA